MRVTPLRSVLACSLALALGLPGSALAASPGKSSKSSKPGKSGKAEGAEAGKDPGDPSVPPPPIDGPPRLGRIYVDADGIGAGGPVIAGRAMRAGTGGLERQAVTITDAPAGPELRIKLTVRSAGGYRVEYEIVYDGKTVKDGTGGFDCQLCTEDELVEKVEALAIQVAPKLVVPSDESDVGPGPGPDGDEGRDPDDGRDPDHGRVTGPIADDDPNALRGMGKAGIALLVVGGLGAITGVTMVVVEPTYFEPGDANANQYRTTRPPGYGLLAGGAAALIAGAVLLGLDRKQAKRRAAGKAEARVHPWVGPQGAGVGVVGRF
jgi:hypothetical protein